MVTDGLTAATRASSTGPESTAERALADASQTPSGDEPALGSLSRTVIAAVTGLLQQLDPSVPSPDPRAEGDDGGGPGLTEVQCIDLLRDLEDLKSAAAGAQVAVTAHLATARHDAEWLDKFLHAVRARPEVMEAHRLAGDIDYILKVRVTNAEAYDEFYRALIADVSIYNVTSTLSMEEIKNTTALPL